MTAEDRIKALARECAVKGLRLREARALFDALHTADAIYAAGGSMAEAAALQGQNREALHRRSIRTQRGAS